jgi:phage gp46-like protein
MAMTFDGDPKITGFGEYDLEIQDGQPTMDEGLENAVTLSLFSSANWWGNAISGDVGPTGSAFEDVIQRTLTNQTRLDAEAAARSALAWLVDKGIASAVDVVATIPSVGMLGLVVTIEQPGRTSTVRYSINWQAMSVRVGAAA